MPVTSEPVTETILPNSVAKKVATKALILECFNFNKTVAKNGIKINANILVPINAENKKKKIAVKKKNNFSLPLNLFTTSFTNFP